MTETAKTDRHDAMILAALAGALLWTSYVCYRQQVTIARATAEARSITERSLELGAHLNELAGLNARPDTAAGHPAPEQPPSSNGAHPAHVPAPPPAGKVSNRDSNPDAPAKP